MKYNRHILFVLLTLFISLSPGARAQQEAVAEDLESSQNDIKQEQVLEELETDQRRMTEELEETSEKQEKVEQQIAGSESDTEKLLLKHLLEVKEVRESLTRLNLENTENLQKRIQFIKDQNQMLADIENNLQTGKPTSEADYGVAVGIWRQVVDESLTSIFILETPTPPQLPILALDTSEVPDKYKSLHIQVKQEELEFQKQVSEFERSAFDLFKTEREVTSRLLLKSGRVRAAVMQKLLRAEKFTVWSLEPEQLRDFFREVQIVPYRFLAYFATKLVELRSLSNKSVSGWAEIIKQLFVLAFVFAIPFLLFRLFRLFSGYLENFRKNVFSHSQWDYRTRTKVALWIARLNPYLPWVFAWMTIELSESLLTGTLLEPLSVIMPYLSIYVLYRAFLIFFSTTLARVLISKRLDSLRAKQTEVKKTAKRLSLIFFIEWLILLTTEDVVRRALVYNAVSGFVFYFNVAMISWEASRWRPELMAVSKGWLNQKLFETLDNLNSKAVNLVVCPVLFFGNMFYLSFSAAYRFTSRFEVGKKISSEIFKKRLEDAAEDTSNTSNSVSDTYKSYFEESREITDEIQIRLSRAPVDSCLETIEAWNTDKTHDDLLLLYGSYGIGKTCLLNIIQKRLKEKVCVARIRFSTKVTQPEQFLKLLSEALGTEIKTNEDLLGFDGSTEKTVIMMDDIHNLFLNTPEGLDAYRTLIELTNLQLGNIFWCLTCNQRALDHLNGVFGSDHFMGQKIELLSWTDSEVQDLILKRHKLSGFRLYYDNVISAVHKGDILESSSDLEVQFFRLLWGQSRGNPLTAQELWLTSVSQVGESAIRVTVPKFASSKSISELSDDALMVFSIIAKHENLSFSELEKVSGMPLRVILHSIKIGEDNSLLERVGNERRWRLHPKSQYVVQAQLSGRNYIYG